ncbi:MAG TPA: DNA polymerase III subunit chi [Cellvibrionaceae bacterium]|nr:DNA polymerase III subunit chi [Cellvibrionaceae bacterium]HNG58715.1 DNA polymerase III subunit chi [Cellvibrionaceae bacterium]
MSGRADFYVLPAGEERHHFACRLIEKAYKLGNKVWLRLDEQQLAALDDALWTFKPEAFVPHAAFGPDAKLEDCPVWLMTQLPDGDCDLLVNLASTPLEPPPSAGRVVELVTQDAHILQLTRQQYARYKALNWVINTHKL